MALVMGYFLDSYTERWAMYTTERNSLDRRSGKDRRRRIKFDYFLYKGPERRNLDERRSKAERRGDWVGVSKWSSVCLLNLKLARYLG